MCVCIRLKFFFHFIFTVRILFSLEFCLPFFCCIYSYFCRSHMRCISERFFSVCSRVTSFQNFILSQICAVRTRFWTIYLQLRCITTVSESKTINRLNGTYMYFVHVKRNRLDSLTFFYGLLPNTSIHNDISKINRLPLSMGSQAHFFICTYVRSRVYIFSPWRISFSIERNWRRLCSQLAKCLFENGTNHNGNNNTDPLMEY